MRIFETFKNLGICHNLKFLLALIMGCMITSMTKGQEIINLKSGLSKQSTININNRIGTTLQDNKRAVCVISTAKSRCSGTLLNTVNQDGRLYILTATHCFTTEESYFLDWESVMFSVQPKPGKVVNIEISFNYEALSPLNRTEQPPMTSTITAEATIKESLHSDAGDIVLLEVNPDSVQDDEFIRDVYFAGWSLDRLSYPETVIAHPYADLKKIFKVAENRAYRRQHTQFDDVDVWDVNGYVNYNDDLEPGSSGGGVLNGDKKIIAVVSRVNSQTLLNNAWSSNNAPLFQKYLDPDFTYVSEIPGGYGLENGQYTIDSDSFNLTLPVGETIRTPDITQAGNTDQMIKLNVWELYELVQMTNGSGGIYQLSGNITLSIKTYLNNNPDSPITFYSCSANGTGNRIGNFEEILQTPIDEGDLDDILSALGIARESLNRYEYNLPVVIEITNESFDTSQARAIKIPGLGYRNAVELFLPNYFVSLYNNSNYPACRASNSENAYIDSLSVKVTTPGRPAYAHFKTSDNGGYVNLIQHKFPDLEPGAIVELAIFPAVNEGTMYASAWIDYDGNHRFEELNENVIHNLEKLPGEDNMTGIFTIPEDLTPPPDGSHTRIRISIRKNGSAPMSGTYLNGEVEDYTVKIIPINDNRKSMPVFSLAGVHYVLQKEKCISSEKGELKWKPTIDSSGITSYSHCDQVDITRVQGTEPEPIYTMALDANKNFLGLDLQSDNVFSSFGNYKGWSRALKINETDETIKLRLYSFNVTEDGQEESLRYMLQHEFYEDASLPYKLLPVSSITSEQPEADFVSRSVSHKDLIGGIVGGGTILATGAVLFRFRSSISTLSSKFSQQSESIRLVEHCHVD